MRCGVLADRGADCPVEQQSWSIASSVDGPENSKSVGDHSEKKRGLRFLNSNTEAEETAGQKCYRDTDHNSAHLKIQQCGELDQVRD